MDDAVPNPDNDGLVETGVADYAHRTAKNVFAADATLRIAADFNVIDSESLSRALQATSRKSVAARKETSNPLHDTVLVQLARSVLADAKGPLCVGTEPFPATIWKGGAKHTGKPYWLLNNEVVKENIPGAVQRVRPGERFDGTIATFADLLRQRAQLVFAKRTGWVVEPTTNSTRTRDNESTEAMHAMFLDADDHGTWDKTISTLTEIGLAFVAYQSNGYKPTTPKWRIVLPLAAPFSVKNDSERVAWKKMYHRCRVLVGALGELTLEGFDSKTDAPSIPWFCTERELATDPPREVRFCPGASLDLLALSWALPDVPDENGERQKKKPRRPRAPGEEIELDDERIDEVVAALVAVTSSIPRGRRELYLALPGVLLDRGVQPDDVLQICTEVSAAYPRNHADKHGDNVHSAQTTIDKWLAKDAAYTRIGTLQAAFPEVAAVLDRLVPDPVAQGLRESMVEGAAIRSDAPKTSVEVPVLPETPSTAATAKSTTRSKGAAKRDRLRKKLEKLAAERAESGDSRRSTPGIALGNVLAGGFSIYVDVRVRERAIKEVFNLIGFDLEDVTFDEVAEVLGATEAETYKIGAEEFAAARGRRATWDAKAPERETKREEEKQAYRDRVLHYQRTGEILP